MRFIRFGDVPLPGSGVDFVADRVTLVPHIASAGAISGVAGWCNKTGDLIKNGPREQRTLVFWSVSF